MAQPSVAEVMSHPLLVISPDATTRSVLATAEAHHIHHFPVVARGSLVGFVCTCDLEDQDPYATVMRFAWRQVVSVSPRCSVVDAARLLLLNHVGSLVVADNLGLHGIVTREDLRHVDPRIHALLESARCVLCGAGTHLRTGLNGASICVACKRSTVATSMSATRARVATG